MAGRVQGGRSPRQLKESDPREPFLHEPTEQALVIAILPVGVELLVQLLQGSPFGEHRRSPARDVPRLLEGKSHEIERIVHGMGQNPDEREEEGDEPAPCSELLLEVGNVLFGLVVAAVELWSPRRGPTPCSPRSISQSGRTGRAPVRTVPPWPRDPCAVRSPPPSSLRTPSPRPRRACPSRSPGRRRRRARSPAPGAFSFRMCLLLW